jgi:hypothetical protein
MKAINERYSPVPVVVSGVIPIYHGNTAAVADGADTSTNEPPPSRLLLCIMT